MGGIRRARFVPRAIAVALAGSLVWGSVPTALAALPPPARAKNVQAEDLVECYRPGGRQKRRSTWSEKNPEGRWRPFTREEIVARDKVGMDLFWLRDEALEDSASLPDPNVLAQEIADDLRAALEQIEGILGDLDERARRRNA